MQQAAGVAPGRWLPRPALWPAPPPPADMGDGGDVLATQLQRLTQALQDLPRLALGQSGLEHPTGSRDVAASQGARPCWIRAEFTHR